MYSALLVIPFLTSSTKLTLCSVNNYGIHYTVNDDTDSRICPVDDRLAHNLNRSETVCSVICMVKPECQNWAYEKRVHVCYTCSSVPDKSVSMDPLSYVKNWQLSGCGQNVELISGPHGIPDQAITASTYYGGPIKPSGIKFSNIGWASLIRNNEQYVQIAFPESRIVSNVCTKGLNKSYLTQYVTSYHLLYGQDCDTLFYITDNSGNTRVFPGNYDIDTAVCADINPPIKTQCLRVDIQTWYGWTAMRFEAIGCII